MKRIITLLLTLILTLTVAGCTQNKSDPNNTPNKNTCSDENPFEVPDEMSGGVLGGIGHNPTNINRDENGKKLPFVYERGEISIPYEVSAVGKAKNVGFLVFVDGVSQPYKTDILFLLMLCPDRRINEDYIPRYYKTV
nr:hypothetical protein [uncultured Caproiciproducens sp.]